MHVSGDWDGWSYLLMSRLPDAPLDVAWPDGPAPGRAVLAAQAGELLAALHQVPAAGHSRLVPEHAVAGIVARQRAACEQS